MMQVYIKYNPYAVETEIKINDEPIKEDSNLVKLEGERLQYWLDENKNREWNGILKELSREADDKELEITFEGRKIDFEDLELASKKLDDDYNITFKHIETKNDDDILKNIEELVKSFEEGPIDELKSDKVKKAYEEVDSSKFKVNVIATMSSGKSTLINSLLGYELLPSQNEACTATIARITDVNDAEEFTAECRDDNGNLVYEKKPIKLEDVQAYNKDEKVTYIDIAGPIPNISSNKIKLLLMDTPGPNNSRNEDHGKLTQTILDDKYKGVILYVINATQFGINDDSELLKNIADSMKRGGKQSRDRFIFAINKCDEFDCEKGESIKNLLESVRDYLKQYNIEEPNLFPISAQTAKLIRMHCNGVDLTRKENKILSIYEDFIEIEGYHFEKLASLSESCKIKIEKRLEEAREKGDKYEEALIHTGVPAIEEAINEYLEKYAYPIKINDAVRDFKTIIDEENMMAKLDESIAADNEKYKEVRAQIEEIKEKLKTSEGAKAIEEKIDNLEIDYLIADDAGRLIYRALEEMTRDLYKRGNVERSVAEVKILKLKDEIKKLEKDLENELNRFIKNTVIDEGERLVNEYQEYVNDLKSEINITGFNFEKVRKFQEINIKNVSQLLDEHLVTEDIYEERIVKNDRKRWYKPWTYFQDSYYVINEKVGEKQVVKIDALIDETMISITNDADANIKTAMEEAENQIKELKEYFKKELEKLDELVVKIVNDLDEKTKSEIEIKNRVENEKSSKLWLEEITEKLNNIMMM